MSERPTARAQNGASASAPPADHTSVDLRTLEAEATYARERHQLYRAKGYGPRTTDPARLRKLERVSKLAEERLRRARSVTVQRTVNQQRREVTMTTNITSDQVLGAARDLNQDEFSRADLARKLGVDRSEFKQAFKAARQSGDLEKIGNDDEGTGRFRLTAA